MRDTQTNKTSRVTVGKHPTDELVTLREID